VGMLLRELPHLARRFCDHVRATWLSPAEQDEVDLLLTPGERALFWAQAAADQRHGLKTAHRVAVRLPGDGEAARAALLHDVGKRHVRLGAMERSLATIAHALHVPVGRRWQGYLDHGARGAEDLRLVSACDLAVAFAAGHPGPAPDGVAETRWQALLDADRR